MKDVLAETKN